MKSSLTKFLTLFLILAFCLFSLTGSYSVFDIDNLAYIVALRIRCW